MPKRMLIDSSHPEETRVVVLDGQKVEEFDFEAASKRPLKGNIYLAKVTRVEPSLQAAFVEYGGNRQGFLAFSEIHPDYYQIPVADRQALLAQQEAEARRRMEDEFEPVETGTAPATDEELAADDERESAEHSSENESPAPVETASESDDEIFDNKAGTGHDEESHDDHDDDEDDDARQEMESHRAEGDAEFQSAQEMAPTENDGAENGGSERAEPSQTQSLEPQPEGEHSKRAAQPPTA